MRPTVQQIYDIAKGNIDDRDLWYREFLRVRMSEGWYPGALTAHICSEVMRLWKPDEVQEADMKIIRATEKKNEKIKERLEELGYDVWGKKVKTEPKADRAKSASATIETICLQYKEQKKLHKDALLLFRVDNNYIAIHDDADAVFAETLSGLNEKKVKGENIKICKFSADVLDKILPQIIRAGNRVAICEQLQDPKKKK